MEQEHKVMKYDSGKYHEIHKGSYISCEEVLDNMKKGNCVVIIPCLKPFIEEMFKKSN
jgi:hypothetical protein